MTDRELLEAAAKAAGLEPFTAWGKTFVMGDGSPPKPEWNPLEDDGDALRLVAKLRIDVWHHTAHTAARAGGVRGAILSAGVDSEADRPAATRRAIVRAAASSTRAGDGA